MRVPPGCFSNSPSAVVVAHAHAPTCTGNQAGDKAMAEACRLTLVSVMAVLIIKAVCMKVCHHAS